MNIIRLSKLSDSEKKDVFELWNNEYPKKLVYESMMAFDEYIETLTEQSHIVLVDRNKKIRGWYFDFIRESERWFAILLDSEIQRQGLGTKILKIAKEKEDELNGWVIDHNTDKKRDGLPYKSPLLFYLKNGFKKLPEIRLESGKISAVKIKWSK